MARKRKAFAQKKEEDPIYQNALVAKLINKVMRDGKKRLAQNLVYRAFALIEKKQKKNPLDVFLLAMERIRPQTEVRPRRVGGAVYQVPMLVRGKRQDSLSIRWLVFSARERSNKDYHDFSEKLAAEIIDASKGVGGAIIKRQEMEKIAEANRAFAHLRW